MKSSKQHVAMGRPTKAQIAAIADLTVAQMESEGPYNPCLNISEDEYQRIFPGQPVNPALIMLRESDLVAATRRRQQITGGSNVADIAAIPSPVTYEDFIRELHRNNIRLLLKDGQIDRYRERAPNRWSVPIYDFGGLFQPSMPDFLGDDLINRLLEDSPSNPDLPAPACVFIQRFKIDEKLDPDQTGLATVLLRVEGLTVTGEPNVTFAAQHQTQWVGGGGERLPGHWRTMEPKLLDADPKLCEWHRRWATEFIAMLAGWHDNIEFRETNSQSLHKINVTRKLVGQAPLPPTKIIHITEQRVQYLRDRTRAGARGLGRGGTHASPHEHLRTICAREIVYVRNGKEVRYHFKKAGQKVVVKPHLAANCNYQGYGSTPVYQIVR